ncbi:hypothetical protein BHE74_00039674, partial [Ensete ventricosum]
MIKLFKLKDQKRQDAANSSGNAPVKKQSAGELRLHKAAVLRDNPRLFETNVRRAMAGGYVGDVHFP